jgi:Uri superfamily endonuclease
LGKQRFSRGFYTYTGSALGKGPTSLKHRISRHSKKEKGKFWHIDYLLADKNVFVKTVIVTETNENLECKTNQYIKTIGGKVTVKGFGASDCRENCKSHLLYLSMIEDTDLFVNKFIRHVQSAFGVLSVYVV